MPGSSPSPDQPGSGRPAYLGSILALGLGVVLSVGVSALFSALGWGGEVASQAAGAASGAAPIVLDGLRYRRARRSEWPQLARANRPPVYRRKLWIVSCFAFALLLLDSAAGLFVYRLTGLVVRVAKADSSRFQWIYALLGGVISLPTVFVGTYLLALAAGHRLGERRRRWILLGMAIYTVVRIANVVAASPAAGLATTSTLLVVGFLITVPLLAGCALLGVARARRTQEAFLVGRFFRLLSPADREAALALLDQTGATPSAPPPTPILPTTPPVEPPGSDAPER